MRQSPAQAALVRTAIGSCARGIRYVAAVLLAASALEAGVDRWTSAGPPGGSFMPLLVDPQNEETIYAFDNTCVYRSLDGGGRWVALNVERYGGLEGTFGPAVMAPSDPKVIYMVGSGGIYRTKDGGDTWAMSPYVDSRIDGLAVDPSNADVVFAATDWQGVRMSTDGGVTWSYAREGLGRVTGLPTFPVLYPQLTTMTIVPGPATPQLCVGSFDYGVFCSRNLGANWYPVGGPRRISHLAADPHKPGRLYALADWMYRSENGGDSWTKLGSPGISTVQFIVDPAVPEVLYSPGYIAINGSGDAGLTWVRIHTDTRVGYFAAVAKGVTRPARMYASGSDIGVIRSDDRGVTWRQVNNGLFGSDVMTLAIAPSDERVLYAAVPSPFGGVFVSTDGGASWNSQSWRPSPTGSGYVYFNGLAVDPHDPRRVLAMTSIGSFVTRDGGSGWDKKGIGLPTDAGGVVSFHPSHAGLVFACTSKGIFRSADGGESWSEANAGLCPEPPTDRCLQVSAIAPDPHDPRRVYAGTADGIFASADAGQTWTLISTGISSPRRLTVDPVGPEVLLAVVSSQVVRSEDRGGHWAVASTGLAGRPVVDLAIDPRGSTVMYAATYNQGVLRTRDGGISWHEFNAGLTNRALNRIVISANGDALHVASNGGGVYSLRLSQPLIEPRLPRRRLPRSTP